MLSPCSAEQRVAEGLAFRGMSDRGQAPPEPCPTRSADARTEEIEGPHRNAEPVVDLADDVLAGTATRRIAGGRSVSPGTGSARRKPRALPAQATGHAPAPALGGPAEDRVDVASARWR